MDFEYISRAKTQEVEREIAQIQLVSAARRVMSHGGAAARPEQRTVSSMPLSLLRRACRGRQVGRHSAQAGTLRSSS